MEVSLILHSCLAQIDGLGVRKAPGIRFANLFSHQANLCRWEDRGCAARWVGRDFGKR